MDRSLARAFRSIAADRRSGATELALRAARAVHAWLERSAPRPPALAAAARALAGAQPSMAPVLRLANLLACAAERDRGAPVVAAAVAELEHRIRTAPARIAARFARALGAGPPRRVLTWSYSGTVVRALAAARRGVAQVACGEGRPGEEGRTTARRLGAAGIDVVFLTDAGLLARVAREPGVLVVIGADAVLRGVVVNKVGTSALTGLAAARGVPVWVLVDTTKLWPEAPLASRHWTWTFGRPAEVWRAPADRVEVENPYFDATPLARGVRLLTEDGWLDARAVARRQARIRISPLLDEA